MTFPPKIPAFLLEHDPFEKPNNRIWPATTFTLHRNLANYNFPPKMEEAQMQQTLSLISNGLCSISSFSHPLFFQAQDLSPIEKEFFFEHYLCTEGFQNTLNGQGFVLDDSGQFFASINLYDHLQLHWIDLQGTWEKTWNFLNQIENQLTEKHPFAFSSKFGFLTSAIGNCGTGLIVRAFLHLPALIHMGQLQEALSKQNEENLTFLGIGGKIEETTGDFLIIGNRFTLGENEETILNYVHLTAMKFMALEKTLRSHIKSTNGSHIKDLLSRAFGLLLHSYQLKVKETLDAISLIKLGVALDWIKGISEEKLDHLFFLVQRAHLLLHLNTPQLIDPTEIAHKRAELIHKNMQGVSLIDF